MEDFIISFVQFLKLNNFHVSNNKIFDFFRMINDISIEDINDLLSLMKICFCNNKMDFFRLEEYFHLFFSTKKQEVENVKIKKEKEDKRYQYKNDKENNLKLIKSIDEEIENIIKKLKEDNDEKSIFSKKIKKFIEDNKKYISKIHLCSDENYLKKFLELNEDIKNIKSKNLLKICQEFECLSEKALIDGNDNKFNILLTLFNFTYDLYSKNEKKELDENIKIEKATSQLYIEKEKLINKNKNIDNECNKIQKELDKLLENRIIKKDESFQHRDFFQSNGNAIICDSKGELEILNKHFNSLNEIELLEIYKYINRNLLKFKTKINRRIHSNIKLDLNIEKTIQEACKTGGLPLNLCYNEPKRNKTNIVLILDVSGSCKTASKMMLSFMYLIQEIFPNGCNTFAFVNSLYNISEVMKADNIDTAITDVLNVIPWRGAYSNYYIPLQTLWEDNKKIITSDSIVIFMGDARNNKNATGEEYLKNISRKAKKCYWLNTENYSKWGLHDSLAFEYMQYCTMFEILTVNHLINFLENL